MGGCRVAGSLLASALVALAACAPEAPPGAETPSVLHRGNGLEPESLDPHLARSVETFNILRDLYEGLVAEGPDGTLGPGAAESWAVSDDGLTWTFAIRDDARWSNGDPVTAGDFAWSLERAVDPGTGAFYSQMLSVIDSARAAGPRTLVLELSGPTPYLPGLLAQPIAFPVHRATAERHGERFTRPGNSVTNGAYRITDWVSQSHVRLERNPHYWNDDSTRIDVVVFHPIEIESTELARYRAGELHMTRTIPAPQYQWLRRNLPDELYVTPYLSTYFYGMNLTRPPFRDNRALRQALSMAIDREIIVEQVTGIGEVAAYGWVPPGIADYGTQRFAWSDWPRERQLEEARRLYAEAGYGPDDPLRIELRYNTAESHRRVAVAVASMWREQLGVEATLHNEEFQVFLHNRQAQRLEIYRSGWAGDYNDANTFAEALLHEHGLNDMGWHDEDYERLVAAASATSDLTERRGLLEEAERIVLDAQPIIPIYFYVSKMLVKPEVGGYATNVMNVHPTRHLYLEE